MLLLSLFTSFITLDMFNFVPLILALLATFESTIKPSAIALDDLIPLSSINTPVPFESYSIKVNLPPLSLPN